MKKLTLFLVLISTGISAHSEVDYNSINKDCKMLESVASLAQGYRQMGYKPSKAVDNLMETTNKLKDPIYRDAMQGIVFDLVDSAYKVQRYSTKTLQYQAISNFADTTYLICLDTFKNDIDK
ncbi:hypothetical protein [Acinetobacter lactucae]|uniref:hypothetical protein n=1 Tax=Acinetobacter lactucae TaxID=1785128 RepID=UPI0034D170F2